MNDGKIKVSINLIRRKLSLQKRKVYFVFGGKIIILCITKKIKYEYFKKKGKKVIKNIEGTI